MVRVHHWRLSVKGCMGKILLAFLVILPLLGVSQVSAQELLPQSPVSPSGTTEQKVDALMDLLGQADVRALLQQKLSASPPEAAAPAGRLSDLDQWASHRRDHIARIVARLPDLPAELAAGWASLYQEIESYGPSKFLLHLILLFGSGLAIGSVTRAVTVARNAREPDGDTDVYLVAVFSRKLLPVLGYGFGVTAMFFAIQWSELLSAILLPWLAISVAIPLVDASIHLLRHIAQARDDWRRDYWIVRVGHLLAIAMVCWALLRTLINLGMPGQSVGLISSCMAALLLLLAVIDIWVRPAIERDFERKRSIDVALTLYLVLLFGLWVAGAGILFLIGFYALVLPAATGTLSAAARKIAVDLAGYREDDLRAVLVGRGVRLFLLATAILWLIYLVRSYPKALPDGAVVTSVIIGLLHGVLVLLLADFAWIGIKSVIAGRLDAGGALPDQDDRLRTVLPILRNMLGILIGAIATMTVLSELGVDIGPLLASAGIFGIAIGFGSQTLVKDIISGVFFMIDDAFRVGEYIQSGSYRGTVESFSVRSVKLRHHRGPIFTVPFGTLGAVENMSRDWSIDKFVVTVGFDTNIAKVKAITKEIGKALNDDPEFGPLLIETVKLKGVEQFGEYGMTLGFGMKLKPTGLQSMIRRKAFAMLKDAFERDGIEFASIAGAGPGRTKPTHEREDVPASDPDS